MNEQKLWKEELFLAQNLKSFLESMDSKGMPQELDTLLLLFGGDGKYADKRMRIDNIVEETLVVVHRMLIKVSKEGEGIAFRLWKQYIVSVIEQVEKWVPEERRTPVLLFKRKE